MQHAGLSKGDGSALETRRFPRSRSTPLQAVPSSEGPTVASAAVRDARAWSPATGSPTFNRAEEGRQHPRPASTPEITPWVEHQQQQHRQQQHQQQHQRQERAESSRAAAASAERVGGGDNLSSERLSGRCGYGGEDTSDRREVVRERTVDPAWRADGGGPMTSVANNGDDGDGKASPSSLPTSIASSGEASPPTFPLLVGKEINFSLLGRHAVGGEDGYGRPTAVVTAQPDNNNNSGGGGGSDAARCRGSPGELEEENTGPQSAPRSHQLLAWFSLIFCCCPIGAIAVLRAREVSRRFLNGDEEGALRSSIAARKWSMAAIAVGSFFTLVRVALYFVYVDQYCVFLCLY